MFMICGDGPGRLGTTPPFRQFKPDSALFPSKPNVDKALESLNMDEWSSLFPF